MLPPRALRIEQKDKSIPLLSSGDSAVLDGYQYLGPVAVVNRTIYTEDSIHLQPEDTFQKLRERLAEMGADIAIGVRLVCLGEYRGKPHPYPQMMAYGTAFKR